MDDLRKPITDIGVARVAKACGVVRERFTNGLTMVFYQKQNSLEKPIMQKQSNPYQKGK